MATNGAAFDQIWTTPHRRRWAMLVFGVVAATILAAMIHAHFAILGDVAISAIIVVGGGIAIALWPALDAGPSGRPMASLIAFVGCDGSGKSTLTEDMRASLAPSVPVRTCYLGLGSGAMGERIKRWPLIGATVERRLADKAARSRTRGQKIPGLITAAAIYALSLLRLRRFKRMLHLRRDGYVVLTDRYPQTEFPGFYDGPGLAAATAGSWAVAQLVRRERRIYDWMTSFRPDVIVRLNVDAATALARKPEHRADLIARKVAITPQLRFAGAPIVDIDARLPYATVRELTAGAVARTLGASGHSGAFAAAA